MLWRNSFDHCGVNQLDPAAYLDAHVDMLIHGLTNTVTAKPVVVNKAAKNAKT
jgi:hypothetical protein